MRSERWPGSGLPAVDGFDPDGFDMAALDADALDFAADAAARLETLETFLAVGRTYGSFLMARLRRWIATRLV